MKPLYTIIFILLCIGLKAQVIIGDTAQSSQSAVVELKKGGLIIPRMSTFQREAMSTGAVLTNSLMVYDTDQHRFFFYNSKTENWVVMNPWETTLDTNANLLLGNYGNVGIGTQYPVAGLSVKGNMSIGENYGQEKAPKNGLLVENKIGIGKNNPSATVDVNGKLQANSLSVSSLGSQPWMQKGMIIMWSGSLSSIPTGWELCDGSFSAGAGSFVKPDLRGRFVIGAGDDYAVNSKYGNAELTLKTTQIPKHFHALNDEGDAKMYKGSFTISPSNPFAPQFDFAGGSSTSVTSDKNSFMTGSTTGTKGYDSDGSNKKLITAGQPIDMYPETYYVLAFIIKVE